MAFSAEWKNDSLVRIGENGWVGVNYKTPQYRAWKYWYQLEFEKRFFPKWLTVQGEWPPTTQAGADSVARVLSEIRDGKYKEERAPIGGRAVPEHPSPWNGFIPREPEEDQFAPH